MYYNVFYEAVILKLSPLEGEDSQYIHVIYFPIVGDKIYQIVKVEDFSPDLSCKWYTFILRPV